MNRNSKTKFGIILAMAVCLIMTVGAMPADAAAPVSAAVNLMEESTASNEWELRQAIALGGTRTITITNDFFVMEEVDFGDVLGGVFEIPEDANITLVSDGQPRMLSIGMVLGGGGEYRVSPSFFGDFGSAFLVQYGGTLNLGRAGSPEANMLTLTTWWMHDAVHIEGGGTFNMYGGTITENMIGVHAANGTFNMHGGRIIGNHEAFSSYPAGTFTIEGPVEIYGTINSQVEQVITISDGGELTVPNDETLYIRENIILENNGTITNNGEISNGGKIINNGTIKSANGIWWGNRPEGGIFIGPTRAGSEGQLGAAIIAAGTEHTTITITDSFDIAQPVTIPADANITLVTSVTDPGGVTLGARWNRHFWVGGNLTLNDGINLTPIAGQDGGGVEVVGSFTMNGGSISGNAGHTFGGGVEVVGSFTMNGGTISGNSAVVAGGGVLVFYSGIFTMNGGTISGNYAPEGSAVDVENDNFTITGDVAIDGEIFFPGHTNTTVTIEGGTLTVPEGQTLSLSSNIVLVNNGTITNNGTISGGGVINNTHGEINCHTGNIAITPAGELANLLGITFPAELTATLGQMLENISLPSHSLGAFSWTAESSTPVGGVGSRVHNVTFTPTANEVYNIIRQDVTVRVVSTDIPGDVNNDGVVNIADLTTLRLYLAGHPVATNSGNADVTGGGVTAADAERLRLYLAGHIETLEQ